MRISSNENIKMIMDILNEVLSSKGLSELNSGVKQFVVNRCEHYHKNRLKYKNTKEANKSIIRESYNYIQKMTVQKKNPNNLSNMHKKSSDFDMRLPTVPSSMLCSLQYHNTASICDIDFSFTMFSIFKLNSLLVILIF